MNLQELNQSNTQLQEQINNQTQAYLHSIAELVVNENPNVFIEDSESGNHVVTFVNRNHWYRLYLEYGNLLLHDEHSYENDFALASAALVESENASTADINAIAAVILTRIR
jgi:hypothetical protein